MLTTASFAVSRQMLHSNVRSSLSFSSVDSVGFDGPGCSSALLILQSYKKHIFSIFATFKNAPKLIINIQIHRELSKN